MSTSTVIYRNVRCTFYRYQDDLVSCQSSSDERVRGMSQDLVARDLKLQTLEDMCERLRQDVKRRDADIER